MKAQEEHWDGLLGVRVLLKVIDTMDRQTESQKCSLGSEESSEMNNMAGTLRRVNQGPVAEVAVSVIPFWGRMFYNTRLQTGSLISKQEVTELWDYRHTCVTAPGSTPDLTSHTLNRMYKMTFRALPNTQIQPSQHSLCDKVPWAVKQHSLGLGASTADWYRMCFLSRCLVWSPVAHHSE